MEICPSLILIMCLYLHILFIGITVGQVNVQISGTHLNILGPSDSPRTEDDQTVTSHKTLISDVVMMTKSDVTNNEEVLATKSTVPLKVDTDTIPDSTTDENTSQVSGTPKFDVTIGSTQNMPTEHILSTEGAHASRPTTDILSNVTMESVAVTTDGHEATGQPVVMTTEVPETTESIVITTDVGATLTDDNLTSTTVTQTDPATETTSQRVDVTALNQPCQTNGDCDVAGFERCVVRQRIKRCECLAGYTRTSVWTICTAFKGYQGELVTLTRFTDRINDVTTSTFRRLDFEAKEGLFRVLSKSMLGAILIDVDVHRFRKGRKGNVVVPFELKLSRAYAPGLGLEEADLAAAIRQGLVKSPKGQYLLDNTGILVDKDSVKSFRFKGVNPCVDVRQHYCHTNALCEATPEGFTCRCRAGYSDTSPQPRDAPGETCALTCDCENGGYCQLNINGQKKCRCASWFLGARCTINGQHLVIALAAILGTIVVVALLCCPCCMKHLCDKRRKREDGSSIDSSPRDSGYKMPSSVPSGRGDTWRYYSFTPSLHRTRLTPHPWAAAYPRVHSQPAPRTQRVSPLEMDSLRPPGYSQIFTIPQPQRSAPGEERYVHPDSRWVWSPYT